MAFTILADGRLYRLPNDESNWLEFTPASDDTNELTFPSLQENLIAIVNASSAGKEGILAMSTIVDRTRYHTVHIHWDWRTYPSTADLLDPGIPDTNYKEFITYLTDSDYPLDGEIIVGAIERLQILINRERDAAGLPVADSDRVNGE